MDRYWWWVRNILSLCGYCFSQWKNLCSEYRGTHYSSWSFVILNLLLIYTVVVVVTTWWVPFGIYFWFISMLKDFFCYKTPVIKVFLFNEKRGKWISANSLWGQVILLMGYGWWLCWRGTAFTSEMVIWVIFKLIAQGGVLAFLTWTTMMLGPLNLLLFFTKPSWK